MASHPSSGHALTALLIFQHITIQMGCIMATSPIPTRKTPHSNYIKNSCNTTLYPQLCYKSLFTFSSRIRKSPRLLAQTALSSTLSTTRKISIKMKTLSKNWGMKPREKAAVADCLEELSDSMCELEMSMKEMGRTRSRSSSNFDFIINDIQTWVSAALTDEDTCTDGFSGNNMNGEVKVIVRGLVLKVAHSTSVALALVNNYAAG